MKTPAGRRVGGAEYQVFFEAYMIVLVRRANLIRAPVRVACECRSTRGLAIA
jgi:hypothetical protein